MSSRDRHTRPVVAGGDDADVRHADHIDRGEGAHTVHANPDWLNAVNDEVASFGCSVVAEYAVLGAYDFVTIIEAPDNETIAHLSVDLGLRGTGFETLPAIPVEALVGKLKGPNQLGR